MGVRNDFLLSRSVSRNCSHCGSPVREGPWTAGRYSGDDNVLDLMCGDLVANAILGEPHPLLEAMAPARLLA